MAEWHGIVTVGELRDRLEEMEASLPICVDDSSPSWSTLRGGADARAAVIDTSLISFNRPTEYDGDDDRRRATVCVLQTYRREELDA